MSFTHALPPACRRAAVLTVVLWAAAPGVRARQGGEGGPSLDHVLVVARTVQPRIAYRGIPLGDHPVRTEATVFPGGVFHRTLDASMERLVGDAELAQLGSLGIERGVAPAFTMGRLGQVDPGLGMDGAGAATPLRGAVGAGAGAVVSAATRGLGSLLQGSLPNGRMLPALATNPGGGP